MVELNIDINELNLEEAKILLEAVIRLNKKSNTKEKKLNIIKRPIVSNSVEEFLRKNRRTITRDINSKSTDSIKVGKPIIKKQSNNEEGMKYLLKLSSYSRFNKKTKIFKEFNEKNKNVIDNIKNNPNIYNRDDVRKMLNNVSKHYVTRFLNENNLKDNIITNNKLRSERLKFINNRSKYLMNNYNYSRQKAYIIAADELKNHKKSYVINHNNNNFNNLDTNLNNFDFKLIHNYYYEEIKALIYDRLIKTKKITQNDISQVIISDEHNYYLIMQKIIQYQVSILKDLKIDGKLKWINGDVFLI